MRSWQRAGSAASYRVGVVGDVPSRGVLLPELRREAVDLHLGVLVVAEQADRTFNDLAYRRHRFAFPYADAESVIACGCVDRQGDGCRKSGLKCFGLSLLKALGVMDSMDDCHEHGVLR